MFLNDLLEPSVIQLCEFGQVMHIGNDVAEIFLQQHKVIFGRHVVLDQPCISIVGRLRTPLIQPRNYFIDLLLARLNSSYYFPRLDSLKRKNFIQLALKLANERLLVIFVPFSPLRFRALQRRLTLERKLEGVFEFVVRDIVVLVGFQ